MENLFLRVVSLSLTTSLVLLPLLLLAGRLRRRYAAKTFYFVWLLLALRLLLPVSLPAAEHAVTVEVPNTPVAARPAPIASEPIQTLPVPKAPAASAPAPVPAAPAPSAPALTAPQLLAALWLAGAALFLLWQGAAYLLSRRALLARSVPAEEGVQTLLAALREKGALRRALALRTVPGLASPMVLGLVRPVLLLPAEGLEGEALAMVLRHELIHLRRWDVAYKALLLLANAVHWFNPLVWWMAREAGRNLELRCDDDVVRGGDADFRRRYGEILIQTAAGEGGAPALSTRFCGGKAQVKRRLKNLFQKKKNSLAVVCLILAAAVLAGSLVACERAGAADRISEDAAIDLLAESIRYDASTGELSFTIPGEETPSHPWQLQIAGRAEFEDGMGMSLHYHTDTQWEPGQSYTENLAEVAEHLTELNMDVTLGVTERTIDLLPYLRPVRLQPGIYQMEVQAGTRPGDYIGVPHIILDTEKRRFTLVTDLASSYSGMGSYEIADGILTASTDDGYYRYVFEIVDGETLAFLQGQSSQMQIYTAAPPYEGALFRLAPSTVYSSEAWGFSLQLPEAWAGNWYAEEESGGTLVTFYRRGAQPADNPAAGVIMSLCVVPQADFEALYGDKDLSAMTEPRIVELGRIGGQVVYLHIDGPEGAGEELARMRTEAAALTGADLSVSEALGTVYQSEAYGFSLQLPESWAGNWRAEETDPSGGDFYGNVAFYCMAAGRGPGAMLLELLVSPEERQEPLLGRERLLGRADGRWVYLYYPQTDLPALAQASEEAVRLYDTMYTDGVNLPDSALTFYEQPGPVYQNETYHFRVEFPASWAAPGTQEWAEDIRITEVSPEEARFSFAGFEAPNGAIAALYVTAEPMSTTARTRLLGSWESGRNGIYYVYLSFEQTGWPEYASWPESAQREIEARIARYEALYADLELLPLSRFDSLAGRTDPQYGEPLWPVAEWTAVTPVSQRPAGEGAGHSGIDIAAPAGTEVCSAWSGTVTGTGFDLYLGNYVSVDTGESLSFRYCHLSSVAVEPGQQVARGTALGAVGRTGQATGDCLHLEVRRDTASGPERIDPMEIFTEPAR